MSVYFDVRREVVDDFFLANEATITHEQLNPYTRMPATVSAPETGAPTDPSLTPASLNTASLNTASLNTASLNTASLTARSLAHLERIRPVLTPDGSERLTFFAEPNLHRTSAGTQLVRLYQHCAGIPVFEGTRVVRFDRHGRLETVFGDNAPTDADIPLVPTLTATEAVLAAGLYLAEHWPGPSPLKVTNYPPRVVASFPLPSRPTVLHKRPFAEGVTAELMLFYHRPRLRLAWCVSLTLPAAGDEFELLVATDVAPGEEGEILLCRSVVDTVAHGSIFRTNPGEEDAERLMFPPTLDDYPPIARGPLPEPFPAPWVAADRLDGNNAVCLFANARRRSSLRGVRGESDLAFEPASAEEEWQINAFFWANYLHDLFYMLGFDEAEGNFQHVNLTDRGKAEDELEVRVYPDQLARGIASIRSRRDGKPCELRLGGIDANGRHTALDADVVIHEYVHGVINRMVGGPSDRSPLTDPQSRALAEGFCDYFALTIQNHRREQEVRSLALWVTEGSEIALRTAPYDDTHPGHFGRLGDAPFRDPHHGGEIWCLALLRVTTALGDFLGNRRGGYELSWQLVVDSLKLLPVGSNKPSFLEARDALLQALADFMEAHDFAASDRATLQKAVTDAFTALGMGPLATSRGASLDGVRPDFGDGATEPPP